MKTLWLQCLLLSFLNILMCRGNICCPKQLEGLIQISDYVGSTIDKVGVNISVDVYQQKYREEFEGTIRLYFYKEDIGFDIINGKCYIGSSGPFPSSVFCIPDYATLSKHYRLGPSLLVSKYTFVGQAASNVLANISRTVTKECIPIFEEQIESSNDSKIDQSARLLIYENVILKIKDPSIFDVPAICKYSQPMNRMKYRQQPIPGRFTTLF